jgi:glutamate dehydrogenase (NAD(P)+)
LDGARVVIQGFGEVGSVVARLFRDAGATIVAVSDSQGGVFSSGGLDLEATADFKREQGTVVGVPRTQAVTNRELLELDCDILVPSALEAQLHRGNAARVNARLVVEAANGPTTLAADDMFHLRGIRVLPDVLANAGGVTVSYFEWVQNIENEQWELGEVNDKLRGKMRRAVDSVLDRWESLQGATPHAAAHADRPPEVDLRTAALVVAIQRVADVALKRGIWP